MTEIYIISGFLGAGKTTLIQKLLTEAFPNRRVALVENDFGEVSVDAALLKGGGYQVKELNAGCICCTLTGDFIAALSSLLKSYQPDTVLIEPSGVGKLSDVEKACQSISQAQVQGKITVVDVKRCHSYLENFGEFFEDQVMFADTILFSRTDAFPDRVSEAAELIATLNPKAQLLAGDWEGISASRILGGTPAPSAQPGAECCDRGEECHDGPDSHSHRHTEECHHQPEHRFSNPGEEHHDHSEPHSHDRAEECHHQPEHHSHSHGEECCPQPDDCHHHSGHTAAEAFDTLTLQFHEPVFLPAIAARLTALEGPEYGTVLRAKGILQWEEGFCNLQFLPGDLKMERTHVSGNQLCIIGRKLNQEQIAALFADA